MNTKPSFEDSTITSIASNLVKALPLLKKQLANSTSVLTEVRIPLSHLQILSFLSKEDSLSISELSSRMGIAKPNITPLLDRLYSEGFISRTRDAKDRRIVNISILPAGQEMLKGALTILGTQLRSHSPNIEERDFRELDSALTTLVRILNDL